jgi:endo-1,4-beta-xylanase
MKKIILIVCVFILLGCGGGANVGLRGLAKKRGIDVGAAVALEPLLNDETYREVLAREYSLITAENVMKFDSLEPERGVYDFSRADPLVDFAAKNNMRVRGHTLVWHNQNPNWLTSGDFTREELIDIMQGHITAAMTHYKGKVYAWDVVNEAMDGSISVWQGIGYDYVKIAFQAARKADPEALLFYNDYGAEGMDGRSDAVYDLVKYLKSEGLIDGVGLQMHVTNRGGPSREDLEANMRRLGELGLIVHITELDVRVGTPETPEELAAQAKVYRDVFDACLAVDACKAVVTWGFSDRYSWVSDMYGGMGAALPFDMSYQPKPAYQAIKEALEDGK